MGSGNALGAVLTAAGYGAAILRAKPRAHAPKATSLVLMAVALLPILWYLAMANHSYNHAFFTSRALVVTAFAVLCALTRLTKRAQTR